MCDNVESLLIIRGNMGSASSCTRKIKIDVNEGEMNSDAKGK